MADPRIHELRALLPAAMVADWVRLGSRLVRLLQDQRHPASHEAVLQRLVEQARASVELRQRRAASAPLVSYPPDLPISSRKDDIVAAIRANQVVVVAGETGSGKTTQIPKMCLEAGLGIEAKIGCTQPRRVAALSISRRIAEELNAEWGRQVGCKIRFDDRSSPETFIKLMTDGILLAETQGDPLLCEYNAIIIDEAHERSLNIDFLLGYLKGLLTRRPELKLIITSATIDTEAFSRAFGGAPIVEVSGRTYPVDVAYAPLDAIGEEEGDVTYIDAAARAAEQVLYEPGDGDVLIFMPGERDIRETADLVATRTGDVAEIIPLFGRLSSAEQQRVFAPASRRKIVIATNIAETSLTIPNIAYVIDSGLARMSRYNARTRTRRLPIEPVSQSSANQRKGRAGRVRRGMCIRLYSEEDFTARPPFTQPEIQRANLAEVILRMKAFRLGEIESFPFLNPPPPAAIQGGYKLLQELGALDEQRDLTSLGRDLARLPIDPTLGRMLLQAQQEHAARELLIIASGLSIQDPRERPLDRKDEANAAHKRFQDPKSDFLTLLNIWDAVHDEWERLRTQNQRRKFCKANFLSYLRMREWQDLHSQLHEALEDLGTLRINESNAAHEAIHKSILTGLLGHLARREEKNIYKGVGNRELTVFPGSALYERGVKPRHGRKQPAPQAPREPSSQPEWIVAGEIVETSQLFVRTLAGIAPLWIVSLAPHLCKTTYQNPRWSARSGQVVADEKITFNGMEVHQRQAAFGNVKPDEATKIFIRSALVEENLLPPPPERGRERALHGKPTSRELEESITEPEEKRVWPPIYGFIEHNRKLREKIDTWRTRTRRHDLPDADTALAEFYSRHITGISSRHDLDRLLRGKLNDPGFLQATESDLTGGIDLAFDEAAFPDAVPVGGQPVPVTYAYAPGEEKDGVTLRMDLALARQVKGAHVEWAVPALREGLVSELLRALPKSLRKQLMPLPPKVQEILEHLQPSGASLKQDLARFIRERYHVDVTPASWPAEDVPPHLRPRIEIVGHDEKTLSSGRDLEALRATLAEKKTEPAPRGEDPAWIQATLRWEKFGLTQWNFGDIPEKVTIREEGPLPVYAWPALVAEEGHVNLRLFRTPAAAEQASGFRRMVELALQKDLAWLHKDLRALQGLEPLCAGFCTVDDLQQGAAVNLNKYILPQSAPRPLTEAAFRQAVEATRARLPGLATTLIDRLRDILKLRQDLWRRYGAPVAAKPAGPRVLSDLKMLGQSPAPAARLSPIAQELDQLLPQNFLEQIPFDQLAQLPRLLKALQIRAERAALNPVKDQERARQVAPYVAAARELMARPGLDPAARERVESFRWMVEEFKVSLFAQELGTAYPVSPRRLDDRLQQLRHELG